MAEEKRINTRRLTDDEIEQILSHANGYINGARRRAWTIGGVLAAVLAASTLAQMLFLQPIRDDIRKLDEHARSLDTSVRLHHENSAKEYVMRGEWERGQDDLRRKVDSLISEVSELKGMVVHIGIVRDKMK